MTGAGVSIPSEHVSLASPLLLASATFAFAGRRLRFRAEDPTVRIAVLPPHDRFLVRDGERDPDCELVVTFGDPAPSRAPVRFHGAGDWELRDHGGGEELCFYGSLDGVETEPLARVRLDPSLRRGDVVQHPFRDGGRTFVVGFPIDEHVANRMLVRTGAVVLHAATVLDGDEAIVFCGHSGAGKSTISKIAEEAGATVLSDDRTILTVDADGVVLAHGTPWHGSLRRGSAGSAPVRAIYLLAQAAEDRVEPLSPGAALGELYVRLIQPSVDAGELVAALDTVGRIVEGAAVATLHFLPHEPAFRLARRGRHGDRRA